MGFGLWGFESPPRHQGLMAIWGVSWHSPSDASVTCTVTWFSSGVSCGARLPQFLDRILEDLGPDTLVELHRRADVRVAEVRGRDGLIHVGFCQTGAHCTADVVQRALLDLGLLQGTPELRVELVIAVFCQPSPREAVRELGRDVARPPAGPHPLDAPIGDLQR